MRFLIFATLLTLHPLVSNAAGGNGMITLNVDSSKGVQFILVKDSYGTSASACSKYATFSNDAFENTNSGNVVIRIRLCEDTEQGWYTVGNFDWDDKTNYTFSCKLNGPGKKNTCTLQQ